LIRLAVRCRAADAETVLADLLEVAPSGVEEVAEPDGRAGVVEYAVYGAAGEVPDVGTFESLAGDALVEVITEEVPDDWEERWKRFYFPVLVAGRLYVRPPWEEPAHRGGVEEVVIDPGGAFGTGTHPTTRMCLELLLEATSASCRRLIEPGLVAGDDGLVDLGTGSGVLAIAAAKLGFEPVLGLDADQAAIAEAARNARENRVEIEVRREDLRSEPAPVAGVVTANLTRALLLAVARSWQDQGIRPGIAIVSGLLRDEADEVMEALAACGMDQRRRLAAGDWAALMLARSLRRH
jgi:ribosomal protein L11 methyltransferase